MVVNATMWNASSRVALGRSSSMCRVSPMVNGPAVGGHAEDVVAEEVRVRRLEQLGPVLAQVAHLHQARSHVTVRARTYRLMLDRADDVAGDRARVEGLRAVLADQPQRLGEVGVADRRADLGQLAVDQVVLAARREVLQPVEVPLGVVDIPRISPEVSYSSSGIGSPFSSIASLSNASGESAPLLIVTNLSSAAR